jgi:nucleotide-binding universal stress UspA family protein
MAMFGRGTGERHAQGPDGHPGMPGGAAGHLGLPGVPHGRPRRVVVGVDGSPGSATAFVLAAAQARQRNATLDVVCVLPADADARAATMARVMLGEFTRRVCPYGVGAPVRFRVERGDPKAVMLLMGAGAELLIA